MGAAAKRGGKLPVERSPITDLDDSSKYSNERFIFLSFEDRSGEGFRDNCCWSRVSRHLRVRPTPGSVGFSSLSCPVSAGWGSGGIVITLARKLNWSIFQYFSWDANSRRRHQKYRRCSFSGL